MLRQMHLCVACVLLAGTVSGASAQTQDAHVHRVRVGGKVMAEKMITQVQPVYPEIARRAGISGTVILHVVIAKDGTVQELSFVSGPPLLMKSSMDAVRQWKYEPTLLNGEPVEVGTTISVIFTLGKSDGAADQPNEANSPGGTESPDQATQAMDPQLKADIAELIQVLHLTDTMTQVLKSNLEPLRARLNEGLPNTPNRDAIAKEFIEKFVALGQSPELVGALEEFFARHLTDEQVKKTLEFYKSDAGIQLMTMQGKMMEEIGKIAERIGREKSASIIKELCEEYPELQQQGSDCKQ